MSLKLLNLESNELGFHISTNLVIPAERAVRFTQAIVEIIRTECGPDAIIEIVEMGRGSFFTRFLVTGAAVATIYMAVDHVVHDLKTEGTEIAQCVAEMVVENGVSKVTAMTCTGSIEVLRDEIPEVRKVAGAADSDQSKAPFTYGGSYVGLAHIDRPTIARGMFREVGTELIFFAEDGESGRVDEVESSQVPPLETSLIVELLATRGDHGGWADRGLRVLRWQPVPVDEEEFDLLPGDGLEEMTSEVQFEEPEPTASFLRGQPRRAFTGEFSTEAGELIFHGNNGQTYRLDRLTGSTTIDMDREYVVIGRTGLDFEHTGHRLLYAQTIMPIAGD